MTMVQLFRDEIAREAERTRRTLIEVPTGADDWKPHEKSMPLLTLAGLVASIPSWVGFIIERDEFDINPPDGGEYKQPAVGELVQTLETHVAAAYAALDSTNDEYLLTTKWRLLAGGTPVMHLPRHIVLRDTINHLAHHRGQLTVYLRLRGAKVPAIYGPSADDPQFA